MTRNVAVLTALVCLLSISTAQTFPYDGLDDNLATSSAYRMHRPIPSVPRILRAKG